MSDDKALCEAETGLPTPSVRHAVDRITEIDADLGPEELSITEPVGLAFGATQSGASAPPISSDAPTELPPSTPISSGSGARGDIALSGLDLVSAPISERYDRERSLGRGGMGQVDLARDQRIGREVAIKSLRREYDADPGLSARFLREARVQGQLEHPAIVPVHDVGIDADGKPYFVMKRLRGVTLSDIVAGLASGDESWLEKHSRRKLLTNFVEVCQAIEFAHSRNVLHRDLKPSNIMLGDFGETYVLDWGLAKIAGIEDDSGIQSADLGDTGLAQTAAGASIGTPGYMSPEQLAGNIELDVRSDVYSLGCVLFEILTLAPLNAGASVGAKCEATLAGRPVLEALAVPELNVAPELAEICARATTPSREARTATVRVLRERIDAYLDGDRDLERRRSLAAAMASEASDVAAEAFATDKLRARERALALVNRALALDPENIEAQQTLMALLLNPPKRPPAQVLRIVSDAELASSKFEARMAVWIYMSILLFGPMLIWMGVRNWGLFFAMAGLTTAQIIAAVAYGRAKNPRVWLIVSAMAMNAVFAMMASRMFGPLIVVPGVMSGATVLFAMHFNRRFTIATVAIGCAAILVPVGLELLEVIPRSYVFGPDGMIVVPQLMNLPAGATLLMLTLVSLLIVALPALTIARLKRELANSQLILQTQSWQLKQLISEHTKDLLAGESGVLPESSCALDTYFGVRVARTLPETTNK